MLQLPQSVIHISFVLWVVSSGRASTFRHAKITSKLQLNQSKHCDSWSLHQHHNKDVIGDNMDLK